MPYTREMFDYTDMAADEAYNANIKEYMMYKDEHMATPVIIFVQEGTTFVIDEGNDPVVLNSESECFHCTVRAYITKIQLRKVNGILSKPEAVSGIQLIQLIALKLKLEMELVDG